MRKEYAFFPYLSETLNLQEGMSRKNALPDTNEIC